MCNAVYHKSYQIGEPVTVMITSERMEITSLPGPDRTITDEERSFFTISIPVNKEFLLPKKEPKTVAKKDNASAKSRRKPSEIKQLILKALSAEGALSKTELVDKMNYKKLTDSVSNAIAELIAEKNQESI
ncbi:MAG: hypothetical protein MJ188_06585 [Treponema sp.]|nr:hypothetical protein [Treponema sp.]